MPKTKGHEQPLSMVGGIVLPCRTYSTLPTYLCGLGYKIRHRKSDEPERHGYFIAGLIFKAAAEDHLGMQRMPSKTNESMEHFSHLPVRQRLTASIVRWRETTVRRLSVSRRTMRIHSSGE